MPRLYVHTASQLARILGVSPSAITQKLDDGLPGPDRLGRWNVGKFLRRWRAGYLKYAFPRREPTPWLDPETPLSRDVVEVLVQRALAEGAFEAD
jgi:hypothetical protein